MRTSRLVVSEWERFFLSHYETITNKKQYEKAKLKGDVVFLEDSYEEFKREKRKYYGRTK